MIEDSPILATWSSEIDNACVFPVMPDGCRDLILKQKPESPPHFFVSRLMATPQKVAAQEGEIFIGIRLKPGATIKTRLLRELPQPDSIEKLTELAYAAASVSADASEMLQCLALAASPATAATELGVSLRTLQRHALTTTGRTPDFWRRLARARKAARCILFGAPLQETAYDCLFSDQAHMTRELKTWFAMTPGELASGRNDKRHPAWNTCFRGYDAP